MGEVYCTSSRENPGRTPPRSIGFAWSTKAATLAALTRAIAFSAADSDAFEEEDGEADGDGPVRGRALSLLHPAMSAASATGATSHRSPRIPPPPTAVRSRAAVRMRRARHRTQGCGQASKRLPADIRLPKARFCR